MLSHVAESGVITVQGAHFVQEDSPHEIEKAIAALQKRTVGSS